MDDSSKLMKKLKKLIKLVAKIIMHFIKVILLPVIIITILLVAVTYYIFVFVDGLEWPSPEYSPSEYSKSTTIGSNGEITTSYTPQEIWDKNENKEKRLNLYLNNAEQLAKLMNAEMVTQFLDTRSNPDEPIDWDKEISADSKKIQGIIKLRRSDSDGNTSTMTYVDSETFQEYIDKYNNSGSDEDRKEVLSHFTLEKTSLSSASADGQAETIEAGTTIKIKEGLGSNHTYMGWQQITSTTSTQYKLREKAGMNFDEEGFGKINGRYVIACTTTYGKVGDYIDFYQDDGSIIPCIIGDIKKRSDPGCNKWGHKNGNNIVEFVVNKETWYSVAKGGSASNMHENPGTSTCHPEWGKNIVKAINGGNYFDNPNFGTDTVTESGKTIENNSKEAMKWPTEGTNITSNYGPRNSPTAGASSNHKGIDIEVPEGTKVYACEDGKITTATSSSSAGNYVVIDHGNGYKSKYMHNSELKVKVGDKVKKGDVIALSGNTGTSTGAHLHFQIENDEDTIDPLTFKYDNNMGSGDEGIGSNGKNIESNETKCYAKVATWNEETDKVQSNDPEVESASNTTYNMKTTNIDYQNAVSKYTMPFDYLWALLVIGEDKDFVLQLADLVYGSQIEITVYDNLTITTNTKVDTYTKKTKTDTEGQVTVTYNDQNGIGQKDTQDGNWSDEKEKKYKVTTTNINKDNILDIALTKANVWIVDYSQEYTYKKSETKLTPNETKPDDEEYKTKPDKTSEEDEYGHVNQLLQDTVNKHTTAINSGETTVSDVTTSSTTTETEVEQENVAISTVTEKKIDYIKTKNYNKKTNRIIKTTNKEETTKYISSPGKIKEKTDKDADEPNFVNILRKTDYKNARHLILDTREWLYEILGNKSTTSEMIDLTKYLLYKVTGKDYGITKYKFEPLKVEYFEDINSNEKSNINGVPGQIADFFLSKGMTLEGVAAILGNIQQECNFNASNISSPDYYGGYHGLCQWGNYNGNANGRFAQLEKLAKNEGKEWSDVDVQLKFIWKELSSSGYKAVKNKLMTASNVNDATEYFARNYEKCITNGAVQQLDKRQKYAKEWLEKLQKSASGSSSDNIDTSSFLATAKSCHDYVRENNYWYPSQANLSAGKFVSDGTSVTHKFPTKGEPASKRYIDCSAYVSWVLKEYGYKMSAPYTASGLLSNPLHLKEVSTNNVKAGDILVRNGHTEIFCGNGKSYNCGSTRAIRSETSNCNPLRFTKAFRVTK